MKNYITLFLVLVFDVSFAQTTPGSYTIKNVEVNTKYSDFGSAFFGKDKIVFASPKENAVITRTTWSGNNQPFLDLYIGRIDETGELVSKKPVLGDVNNKYHEGIVAFTKDLKTVYFDANNYTEKGKAKKDSTGTVNIQLYKAQVAKNGEWHNIVKLPFNSDQFSTGHPALSLDDKKLYFVSDRPGSLGKTDIFVVDINDDGTYSLPHNMGPRINTTEREMFPFVSDENILYFSSDGHPGYGNLDVFASRIFDTTVSDPINLEDPVNTVADDFAFIVDDINHNGYFSSNRKGGKGDDDIYHFVAFPPLHIDGHQAIAGVVTDKISGIMIPGATVTLLDENGKELETIKLPDAVSEFVPYTNDPDQPQISELKIEKGEIEDIRIQKTVDNESPNPDDIVEFTVEISNLGTTDASGIKVSDILPKGYVYIADDSEGEYDKSDDNISIAELAAGNNKVLKIKARIAPVEVNSAFSFNAISNTNYKINVSAPGYLPFVTDVKTANDTDIPPLEVDLILDQELRVDNEKIMVNINTIYFDFDKWNIRPDAARELDKVIAVMKEHPSMVIQSGSHTDSRGSDRYNQKLSQRRAQATVDYIVSGGIDRKRITAKGYGESQLVNGCTNGVKCSKEEQQLNRRTEFVIVNDNERIASTDATIENVIVGEGKLAKDRDTKTQVKREKIEHGSELRYQIVVGSFKKLKNAERRVNQLKGNGYGSAGIIRDKKSSLVKVSAAGYNNKQEALRNLEIVRRELDKDAWLLKLDQPLANTEAGPATDKVEGEAEKTPDEKPIQANSAKEESNEVKVDTAEPEVKAEANQDDRFSGSVARKTADHYIEIPPVYFKYDRWSLSEDEFVQLDKIIQILKDNPTLVIEAGVHTDTKNLESYNLLLSQKRAKTIVDYIVSKGINADRIYGKGYGEEGIVNICKNLVKCAPEEHQENRRTEFMIIEGNGYPETELTEKNGVTFINTNPIYFDKDSDKIRKDAAYELDRVAAILMKNPEMNIEVESHTDSQNVKSYNLKLSQEMAESVKEYLISKGVDSQRIRTVGYGESGLLNKCTSFVKCTPGEHQKNRRTEIKVIKK